MNQRGPLKVLLISEATLTLSGRGPNITLANLLSVFPPSDVLSFASAGSQHRHPPAPPWDTSTLTYEMPPPRRSGALRYLRQLEQGATSLAARRIVQQHLTTLQQFKPDILLATPFSPLDVHVATQAAQLLGIPHATYITDDWPAIYPTLAPIFGPALQWLVSEAQVRYMISHALSEEYSRRHGPGKVADVIVQSPVDLDRFAPPHFGPLNRPQKRLVYTGSLHPMHLDALVVLAAAALLLRQRGMDVVLRIHTQDSFWQEQRAVLEPLGVESGGHQTGPAFPTLLKDADWLVIPSSFLPAWSPYTRFTIQTKLGEYLSTGRPVMAVGPADGACSRWIAQHGAGAILATPDVTVFADQLAALLSDDPSAERMARAGYQLALAQHAQGPVQQRFSAGLYKAVGRRHSSGLRT